MFARPFQWFTTATFAGCGLLIAFGDQPLAWLMHRYCAGLAPFFAAYTAALDAGYDALVLPQLLGLPLLFTGLLGAFVLVRIGLRHPWGNVFLVLLLTHIASVVSVNVLKMLVHRLRPEVLFGDGYAGLGLWQPGPQNDSFPSGHVAGYLSLFWPVALVAPRYRLLLLGPGLIGLGRLVLGLHYVSDVWFSVWLVVAFTKLFHSLAALTTRKNTLA